MHPRRNRGQEHATSDKINTLTETVRGPVITALDPDYDDARAVYNAMHDRLSVVKAIYDPDNLFHVNQNIAPANWG